MNQAPYNGPTPPAGMSGFSAAPVSESRNEWQQPQKPAKSNKRKIALIAGIIALVLVFFSAVSCSLQGAGSPFASSVAVIHMQGTIGEDGGACSSEGLQYLLEEAEADPSIAAVVLRVDSGGGYSASGEEMARYVADFSKPIVTSTATSNASAAYLISSQTDYIYANASSSVGSIGTVMQTMDYSGLLDMLGIEAVNITSSDNKDASYGTRSLTKEEIAYYQRMVDQINNDFINSVAEGRNMNVEDVKALATGMPFTGTDGVANGLIDEIGTFADACDKAAQLAGLSSYNIVSLENEVDPTTELLEYLLLGSASSSSVKDLLAEGVTTNGYLS